MEIVRGIFNDRKHEVDLYFKLIVYLDELKKTDDEDRILYDKDIIKIVRANALLMLYNLVESTLVNGIEEVYNVFKTEQITYSQVSREIQDIWFNYKFSNAYNKNAQFSTYKKTAEDIVFSILGQEPLVLDRKATGISGNLDAQIIRDICRKHGITFKTPSDCHGGNHLTIVKEQRNQLAHGTLSFVECGRDFTVNDLVEIKAEVENFLIGFIDAIEAYYDNKEYLLSV